MYGTYLKNDNLYVKKESGTILNFKLKTEKEEKNQKTKTKNKNNINNRRELQIE